jgi:hypothetical protein
MGYEIKCAHHCILQRCVELALKKGDEFQEGLQSVAELSQTISIPTRTMQATHALLAGGLAEEVKEIQNVINSGVGPPCDETGRCGRVFDAPYSLAHDIITPSASA